MLMPDVNLLVYAHRVEALEHDQARGWLEALASGRRPFARGWRPKSLSDSGGNG